MGSDIAAAAAAFERWSVGVSRPLVVTLHDVPGADVDASRDARRADGYRRVAAASDGIIVSSHHEAGKVTRFDSPYPTVIELPLPAATNALPFPERFSWDRATALAVIGFVYPGKGHAEVVAAAGRLSPAPPVVALGAISPGHESLGRELQAQANRLGVALVVTGALTDREMAAGIAAVRVPMVPGRHVSASASLLTWVGHRRRPLVAAGPYGSELATRHPEAVQLYDHESELDDLIRAALVDPARTHLGARIDWPDVAGQHLDLYRALLHRAAAGHAH